MEKKLTIIIPTFNRSPVLKNCIESLISQIDIYQSEVDLLVLNNASKDSTEDVVKYYQKNRDDYFKYVRHSENIGSDKNYEYGITNAQTDYVYLIGDDDVALPNLVVTLLDLIKTHPDVSLFHIGYMMGLMDLSRIKPYYKRCISSKTYKEYASGDSIIADYFSGMSFISSNMFKRSVWKKNNPYPYGLCPGYEWVLKMFNGILEEKCAFCYTPIIIQRTSSFVGYSKDWTYYSVISFSRLIKLIDTKSTGLFSSWMIYRRQHKIELYSQLRCVLFDRSRYKSIRKEFYEFLPNKRNVITLWLYLYLCPAFYLKRVVPIYLNLLNYIKNKCL